MTAPMRIAVTVDPYIPVPPVQYGGIERVVDFVVRGLVERGHDVTLFAHPASSTGGRLLPYGTPPHWGAYPRARELADLGTGLWTLRAGLDAILSWGRLAALTPVLPIRSLAKIQRYCRGSVPWRSVAVAQRVAGESILFAGASRSVYESSGDRAPLARWVTIFDGVELAKYTFEPNVPGDAPLVFLGRLERIKGVHSAIAIARESNRRLVIAGNRVEGVEGTEYFEREIRPHIGDDIEYIGPVDDSAKNRLLGRAAALLMPIEWNEAFGIVMAEAFACGTPVIGFARGSVPEVVSNGTNGFVCTTISEAAARVARLGEIDRRIVHEDCERRFASERIVDEYERSLRDLVALTAKEAAR